MKIKKKQKKYLITDHLFIVLQLKRFIVNGTTSLYAEKLL